MMFAIQHTFNEDIDDLRAETRPHHIKYLSSAGERLMMAGPMMASDTTDIPVGSLIIIKADSLGAAKLFAENDPYVTSGMVATSVVTRFVGAIGEWMND